MLVHVHPIASEIARADRVVLIEVVGDRPGEREFTRIVQRDQPGVNGPGSRPVGQPEQAWPRGLAPGRTTVARPSTAWPRALTAARTTPARRSAAARLAASASA